MKQMIIAGILGVGLLGVAFMVGRTVGLTDATIECLQREARLRGFIDAALSARTERMERAEKEATISNEQWKEFEK